MMQFLKSTLFPDSLNRVKKASKKKDDLEKRILLLESEKLENEQQIEELRTYVQSMAVIVTQLSSDLYAIATALSPSKEKTTTQDIFSMYKLDDDDDGYFH